MSPSEDSEQPTTAPDGQGVLSNLPRTRPQRASPRRAAAREALAAPRAATATPAISRGRIVKQPTGHGPSEPGVASQRNGRRKSARSESAAGRRRDSATRAARPSSVREEVPRQGFACAGERASGPVSPPGVAEFAASAAEIVSELGKAGLSTGERLIRDVVSRLAH
jgi:hypothetical protein